MSKRCIWKNCLSVLFLLAIASLVIQPAFADGQLKNKEKKEKDEVTASPETPKLISQDFEIILTNSNGPPISFGPGWYYKEVPGKGNDKILYKEFKNDGPNLNSGWIPYAQ